MQQVLQHLRTGQIEIAHVPPPVIKPNCLLSQTRCSLISSGTERMLISFAKSNFINKAQQQPDKVKQVIEKIRTDGLASTLQSVAARLDEPLPLGYCNCGTVTQVGPGVSGFFIGDRIISNGPHAEMVCVPAHLCARVPDTVTDEQAVFTVPASIALQGIRLIKPTFGETISVIGVGLIGLFAVQLLRANGCEVIAVDVDAHNLQLAQQYGAHVVNSSGEADPIEYAHSITNGHGVDGVLITASAKHDSVVHQAATMCRKRGRIVLVGVVDLHLNRADFYKKELTFQVSCSYGPGRYDERYENDGHDYPFAFVRWTEQRNFHAILKSFVAGHLDVKNVIGERIPLEKAERAYRMLMDDRHNLALILTYPNGTLEKESTIVTSVPTTTRSTPKATVGLIGAGNFARIMLLPALKPLAIRRKTIADVDGIAGQHAARKFDFEFATNDYHELLNDGEINTVFIATRHDLHAQQIIDALDAGKHVAVEKPLCLNADELSRIKHTVSRTRDQLLMVGFNRRFSPFSEKIKMLLADRREPVCMVFVINAGKIPAQSWVHSKNVGGGRVLGEGCHWIDLMRFWVGRRIVSVCATMLGNKTENSIHDDTMSLSFNFEDGSIGTLHYFANGHKRYAKENCMLFCEGKILELDNFRKLTGYGWRTFSGMKTFKQDKGHHEQFSRFIDRVHNGGEPLIPFDEIENVTLASFAALKSAEGAGLIYL